MLQGRLSVQRGSVALKQVYINKAYVKIEGIHVLPLPIPAPHPHVLYVHVRRNIK